MFSSAPPKLVWRELQDGGEVEHFLSFCALAQKPRIKDSCWPMTLSLSLSMCLPHEKQYSSTEGEGVEMENWWFPRQAQ